ncbi:transcription factor BEE 1-like isoform X2 [Salvia hispanica]|uniref:transcription factor BEE 1-like isoform X2 n=1 Tax=Salvia hispanica TaxID=49212 RepID=UPI0020092411|nr:transcription factor BEE 1-like isoform X2 [Salvia hispanica]
MPPIGNNLRRKRSEITILPSKMFFASECYGFESFDHNNVQHCTINHSIPPISEDQLRLWLQNAPQYYMEGDGGYDHLSNCQSRIGNPSENSSLDINLHGFDNSTLSSNTQTSTTSVRVSKVHGDERKEVADEETIRRKRPRSTEAHNLNERLRRRKINQKMATLQEMIPNSNKDQASTIDDVIKYIKTLQHLVEMMSTETNHIMHQGIKTPTLTSFQQGGNGVWLGFPIGVYNPWFFQSSMGSLESQFEPMYANGISCFGFPPSTLPNDKSRQSYGASNYLNKV